MSPAISALVTLCKRNKINKAEEKSSQEKTTMIINFIVITTTATRENTYSFPLLLLKVTSSEIILFPILVVENGSDH